MILKASERGGARQLGLHLLKAEENEHVEVHEIRGFMSDNVLGAMKETQAIALGTKCTQHLFSLSLNPPHDADVSPEVFESALAKIEDRTGLTGQPRIIVFHEKDGRRHAHCVWSRIKADEMKAVQLSHFKNKLQEVSRELYIEHGWEMPEGLMDKRNRDPRNFTLAEWQQAKRIGHNAKDLKTAMQEAWNISDSRKAFERALEDRGMFLAKGDKRGHVAVTYEGEAISIARYAGKKSKEIRDRLGKPDDLRSVAETQAHIANFMTPTVKKHIQEHNFKMHKDMSELMEKRETMALANQRERNRLKEAQKARWNAEIKKRSERMNKGFRGLWNKLTGKHARFQKQNEMETFFAYERDKKQNHDLRTAQMNERRNLQAEIQQKRQDHTKLQSQLYKDLGSYRRIQERQISISSTRSNALNKLRNSRGLNVPKPPTPSHEM